MKEHYILGDDVHLTVGLVKDAIPLFYDNIDTLEVSNKKICFIFNTDDHQTFRVFIDKKQAKAIRKFLKTQINSILGEE